jgi:DNA-binding NarL/FixJ family response regulator
MAQAPSGTRIQTSAPKAPLETLSQREHEVLSLVSHGSTNGEIAASLDLTVHAVKFHLASVYRKLGVANRTEATFVFLSAGAPGSPSAGMKLG